MLPTLKTFEERAEAVDAIDCSHSSSNLQAENTTTVWAVRIGTLDDRFPSSRGGWSGVADGWAVLVAKSGMMPPFGRVVNRSARHGLSALNYDAGTYSPLSPKRVNISVAS